MTLDLAPDHRAIVLDILRTNLPSPARAWAFGSRATGRARRYSDLDLAIDLGRPLTVDERAALSEAFEESDLPFLVDVIDWQSVSDRFRQIIAADRIALEE
jgi:predicted nucleotidyltransferase